jgi:hypothetical protein
MENADRLHSCIKKGVYLGDVSVCGRSALRQVAWFGMSDNRDLIIHGFLACALPMMDRAARPPKTYPNQAIHNTTLCLLAARLRCVGVVKAVGGCAPVRPKGLPIRI